jgi:hypothetical protein
MKDPRTLDTRDDAFERDEDTRDTAVLERADDARDRGRSLDMREVPVVREAQLGQRAGHAAVRMLGQAPFSQFLAKGKG